jgi:hypothetical protein
MSTVGYANPDGKGARRVAGQPGWQPDGSYLTPEGQVLADEVTKAGYLRTVQEWIIAPQLKNVPGVAGVDSIGGYAKTFVVEPDPTKLIAFGISYSELAKALKPPTLRLARTTSIAVARPISCAPTRASARSMKSATPWSRRVAAFRSPLPRSPMSALAATCAPVLPA